MKDNAEILNSQAIELASHGQYVEAIACFKRAITIVRDNPLLWYNLGITYRDAGMLQLSKDALLTAYRINSEDQDIIETLAPSPVPISDARLFGKGRSFLPVDP